MIKTLWSLAAAAGLTAAIFAAAPQDKSAEAARLNNIGAAYMNQQLFEKGLKAFQEAAALDPSMYAAELNQGIALLNLGRVDEARKILEDAGKRQPSNPRAWYNLGLLNKNSSDSEASVDAFRHVTELDGNDADSWYFLGTAYSQSKQFPQAIDAFEHALKLNPLHASAEFGLSRAYQQSGDVAHAREHLQRFQYVTQNKLGSPISLAYGEQGQYSRVEESAGIVAKAPSAIPVKFVNVTEQTGLVTNRESSSADDLASFLGPGACFLDYDGDGNIDLFLPDYGPKGGLVLFHNSGSGKYEDVTSKAGLDSRLRGIGCSAGDYDNDGAVDIAVTTKDRTYLLHNQKNGTFTNTTDVAGINPDVQAAENTRGGLAIGVGGSFRLSPTFIDYDHDGDVDLYVTQLGNSPAPPRIGGAIGFPVSKEKFGNTMWRNNGNGTFTNVSAALGLSGVEPSVAAVGTDYNNDRAVDLVVSGVKGPTIFENPREGRFLLRPLSPKTISSPSNGVAVLDFDHDGWMDIAFTQWSAQALTLWRNAHGKFEQVAFPTPDWERAWGVAAFDYDDDGWVDLIAVGEARGGKGEVRLFRNLGAGGFTDVTTDVGLDQVALKDPRAVIAGDYDNDGAVDLLITENHGSALLLRNQSASRNNWMRLALKGLNDNKSAIGTKVEVFAGGNRQKFEIAGSSGYLGQNSPFLTVGLGQAKEADVVRMLWPTGVLQDEIEVAGLTQQDYTELDRRGSSCPTLFVWDGDHYQLVGDLIGAGVVGHWVAPGERNIPRPTEYYKLDRTAVRVKHDPLSSQSQPGIGRPTLSFRLMEPMEEVVYLDRVKLLAVDHPAGFEVYPNEYFASNPPYPDFKVVASGNARPPAGAWDEHGHDLLPDLLAHRYVGDFELEPFKGFTKPHRLELDLGEPYRGGPLWLLLHGEIEYFTATGMYAASQAGLEARAPYVEALSPGGKWTRVVADMGFPAGGPRTMTADLSGKLLPGTRRIRISTNLQIYWDSILVDRTRQNQTTRLTWLPLLSAELRFHGYPRQMESQPPGVVKYMYEQVSRTGPYARQSGTYTRYGDVRSLLAQFDDQLAVFGSGEEVALEFDPGRLPSLPADWVRDYFFLAQGYEKDMDFYAADGSTVEPLPFRAMGTYPYKRPFPLDDRQLHYMLQFNTRYVSGNEPWGYWYQFVTKK